MRPPAIPMSAVIVSAALTSVPPVITVSNFMDPLSDEPDFIGLEGYGAVSGPYVSGRRSR